MPDRRDIFYNRGIYHVFNKTIDSKRIFLSDNISQAFIDTLKYYRSIKIKLSLSRFKALKETDRSKESAIIAYKKYFMVDILGYCLMPTHFHLLLMQLSDDGIKKYMSDVSNSFTRYYNIRKNRKGPLFMPRFKSREIVTDDQLKHVSRYIHLNPYSSKIIDSINMLDEYKWSSYAYYIKDKKNELINTKPIFELFNFDKPRYRKFVENNADYQRSLERFKYVDKW